MAEFKRSYQQDIRRMQTERDEYSQVSFFSLEYDIKVNGSLNIYELSFYNSTMLHILYVAYMSIRNPIIIIIIIIVIKHSS